jgi:hypothetical protein
VYDADAGADSVVGSGGVSLAQAETMTAANRIQDFLMSFSSESPSIIAADYDAIVVAGRCV